MTTPLFERVLSCAALPSLPAVALEVLDLSRDPDVSLAEIAAAVENDQALTTKILKTVNSSFYGLSRPCPSIDRALAYLGLSTVKSLVLGFSLVDCFRGVEPGGFDLLAFWRRAVYSAAGARVLAAETKAVYPDEAFIAALLQDIGVLTMHVALGSDYDAAIAPASDRHERQASLEMEELGFNHMTVGAELASRWRLPAEMVAAIRHHHAVDHAPEHRDLLRIVSSAGLAAAALGESDHAEKVNRFVERVREWFGIERASAFGLLKRLAGDARALGRLFDIRGGESPDVVAILGRANELMLQHQMQIEREASALRQSNDQLARQSITDALTNVGNRKHFDETLHHLFEHAAASGHPLSLIFIDADHFKRVNDAHGHPAGDVVLTEIAGRLSTVVRATDLVFRYGGEEFAVLVPRAGAELAAKLGDRLRAAVGERPFEVAGAVPMTMTISVGVAAFVPADPAGIELPADLIGAADEAVYAAKQLGRDRVVTYEVAQALMAAGGAQRPAAPDASEGAAHVLIVEDNYLASALMARAVESTGAFVEKTGSAESALDILENQPGIDLVLADLDLPGMSGLDLIRCMRADERLAGVAVVVVTGSDDARDHRACMAAGANAFISKAKFCDAPERWAARIMDIWLAPRRAG